MRRCRLPYVTYSKLSSSTLELFLELKILNSNVPALERENAELRRQLAQYQTHIADVKAVCQLPAERAVEEKGPMDNNRLGHAMDDGNLKRKRCTGTSSSGVMTTYEVDDDCRPDSENSRVLADTTLSSRPMKRARRSVAAAAVPSAVICDEANDKTNNER